MISYIVILFTYIAAFPMAYHLSGNLTLGLMIKLALTGSLVIYFRRDFEFRLRWDWLALPLGILIGILWVGMDALYPHSSAYVFDEIDIAIKMMTGIWLAPIVEEFFTRFFLLRYVIDKKWRSVPLGKFTWSSFIITVLFFGFSHQRWLAGIIAGVLFNVLFYYRKNMNSLIISHGAANLVVGLYVIMTQSWQFW